MGFFESTSLSELEPKDLAILTSKRQLFERLGSCQMGFLGRNWAPQELSQRDKNLEAIAWYIERNSVDDPKNWSASLHDLADRVESIELSGSEPIEGVELLAEKVSSAYQKWLELNLDNAKLEDRPYWNDLKNLFSGLSSSRELLVSEHELLVSIGGVSPKFVPAWYYEHYVSTESIDEVLELCPDRKDLATIIEAR